MKLHYFQHVEFEGLAMIEGWAKKNNHTLTYTKFFQPNFILPPTDDYDALIILGGSMSTSNEQQYPWLITEKQYIKTAIDTNKHILGICLGAQLIADVLQATITPHNHKEIGYFPISFIKGTENHPIIANLGKQLLALNWHSDRFEIPQGAIHLASSEACDNQAFLYNKKVLGLQFHLEVNLQTIEKIITNCGSQIQPSQYIQDKEALLEGAKNTDFKNLYTLLDNWVNL